MNITFESLELSSELLKALIDMGFTLPTEVQEKSIPVILKGQDVIVKSKTGSGKTAAFGIPLYQRLLSQANLNEKPKALIITPTRELAVQVDIEMEKMGRYTDIKHTAVCGQHNIHEGYGLLGVLR